MTMDGNNGDGPKGPPPAVVEAALASANAPEEKNAQPVAAKPAVSGIGIVGDNYSEPEPFATLRQRCVDACTAAGLAENLVDCKKATDELSKATLDIALRFDALYRAAMPLAKHASHMANMRMQLFRDGRKNEPPGGTWLNGIQGGQLQPNAHVFFSLCDVVGRKAVEDSLMADFTLIQNAMAAAKERDAHITKAGRSGGPGSPIGDADKDAGFTGNAVH